MSVYVAALRALGFDAYDTKDGSDGQCSLVMVSCECPLIALSQVAKACGSFYYRVF